MDPMAVEDLIHKNWTELVSRRGKMATMVAEIRNADAHLAQALFAADA